MNGSFRMKVAAALSLILSLSAARSRGAMVTVQSGGALLVQSRSNIVFVNSLNVPENRGKTVVSGASTEMELPGEIALCGDSNIVKYSGSQLSGVLLGWNGHEMGPIAAATSAADEKTAALTRMESEPFYSMVNEVPVPTAGWVILAGLAGVAIVKNRTRTGVPVQVRSSYR